MSEHHSNFAERRAKRHADSLKDAAREAAELRAAGMTAMEIVAAFRARRRLCIEDAGERPMIGQVSLPIDASECLMLEIYDDIDDD